MIADLNLILRDLLQSRVARGDGTLALAGPTQVGFEPPNEEWHNATITAREDRLNLYLYDLRENPRLRSSERIRSEENGMYRETPVPPRLDCSYLVTAWSPVRVTPGIDPALDEHGLLYAALAVLMRFRPLAPAEVYETPGAVPSLRTAADVPAALRAQPLPLEVALPEAEREPVDFWTTMKLPWKPGLRLTATVPVIDAAVPALVPPVTLLAAGLRPTGDAGPAIEGFRIGGRVLAKDPAGNEAPVAGAWLQVRGESQEVAGVDQRLTTGADGRYRFSGLRRGRYRLRAVAAGVGDHQRAVDVPSDSGEYDVRFP